jgi:hypothetical protein
MLNYDQKKVMLEMVNTMFEPLCDTSLLKVEKRSSLFGVNFDQDLGNDDIFADDV